ncbi:tyrosine-type recombinase/integrase [Pseudonocardia sediminis]|uniref:tyrosine-type recombinase/integrase n=1 Tax=Pseudonocardia sediminis TaxID=1397368 RepID=UPI001F5EED06|nr:tyrosine-type recombinase/integrase [Pseudonocardia sediminis]
MNTWRAYRSDHARFAAWCGAQDPPESALPAAPVVLARYLVAHAGARRPATLARWCSSIAVAHDLAGHPSPTRDEQVRTVLAGIRRTHRTRPARVAAASPDDLRAMMIPLDPKSPRDARDRALLLIGFAGALRRSELVALTLGDITLDSDGLRIFIASSKTDPHALGHTRGLSYGSDPATCPVRAWQAWLQHRLHSPTAQPATGDPARTEPGRPAPGRPGTGDASRLLPAAGAFVAVDRWGRLGEAALSDRSVARIVAERADAAGLPGHWAGHSLRRGFATTAHASGASEVALMRHGRWRSSSSMRGYIDEGTVWSDNPTRRLGL